MRILITGSTGFIGMNLVPYLKKRIEDCDICLPCRCVEKGKSLFPNEKVISIDAFEKIMEFNPEVTIHLAGYSTSRDDEKEVEPLIEANITYGVKLLNVLAKCQGMKLFLNTGSFSEYEMGCGFKDAYLYSASKTAFRAFIDYYARKGRFKYVTAVLYSVYGGKQTVKRIMDYVVESLDSKNLIDMTPGEQLLDFIHMDDVCAFYGELIKRESLLDNGMDFHVGTGIPHTIKEMVGVVEKVTSKRANINWGGRDYRDSDIMFSAAPQAANLTLGWRPKVGFEEGIRKFINDLRKENRSN